MLLEGEELEEEDYAFMMSFYYIVRLRLEKIILVKRAIDSEYFRISDV